MSIYTVTTTADTNNPNDGIISLREAIALANANAGNDQINFNLTGGSNPYTIYLGSSLPDIINASTTLPGGGTAGNITISGPGAASLIIDAQQGNYRIFNINTGGNLTISGVTVTGANLSGSGGAFSNSGALNIYSSTISGNSVTGNGANGGGIFNKGSGTLNIFNSTISGNIASGASSTFDNYGGGINNSGTLNVTNSTISGNSGSIGGGINNSQGGTLTVTNSTLSGNTATANGGGMNNYNALTVTNCTFSGNSAATAGGLQNNGTLNIANTIIANSTKGGDYFGGGTIGTNLNNLVKDGTLNNTTGYSSGSGNISGDPKLSPLANNGGPTFTMALGDDSPAIAAGDATVSNVARIFDLDQRGYTRSYTSPSIGAYEYNTIIPIAPTVTGVSSSTGSAAGGNSITITGTNLAGATAVSIGGTPVNFTVVSPTSITTTTPAHTAGAVSIDVTTVSGTNLANSLYSYKPTVTQNLSNLANNATTLTITGTGFDPIAGNNTVILSSGTGTVTSATATQLTVTFNTVPDSILSAEVITNEISSGTQVEVATIVSAPVITSISPAAGPRAGGSTITIKGSSFVNFYGGTVTEVTIGGIPATSYTVNNEGKITATIPPGIFGPANVLVTTVDGTNSTTANTKFNYTAGAFDAPAEPFAPAFPHAISIMAPGSVVGTSASFTVTFNQPVTGVAASDFSLITTGTVEVGTIPSITGSGDTYTVNVTGITGSGTLGLNMVNLPTITALPSFAAQATLATGSKPASVILGDVNGDGELDIITANFNSANVSVLLGKGNGNFEDQQTFATGTKPFAVKLGDINGDGSVDIITANQDSDTASVLLGNNNGTFQTQTTFSTGDSPRSVALGDLNGDGTLDIITANEVSNNVSVLLGTGNGNFAVQATFSTSNKPYSVTVGDVNGDGKLDIVSGHKGSKASVLLGNGDGTFANQTAFDTGGNHYSVALGDLNGDGRLDIVTANKNFDIAVLLGNGDGQFKSQQIFRAGTNPRSVTLSDVNGDGRLDIITANFGSTDTSVLLGNGNGTFQGATKFATGTNSRSATLGDVNGDGRLDIIAANYNSDNASVILGTGGSALFATFSPQQTFAAGNGAQSQALGDLNGDGKLDMVTANGSAATASVLLGNGNGTFQTQATVSTGTAPRSVTLGDVNDDGKLDIITANRESNTASVLLGNGNGTFQTQTTVATGNRPYSVTLGDVNGDGRLDIITANNNDNNASVLLGNGNGTFQTQATFATGSSPRAVAMGDVDGDGKLDIITANHGDASVSVLFGNGNGTFKPNADFATGSNPRALTLGDVNGDGNLDIITANFANSVSVLLGNGNGTFKPKADFATEGSPRSVALGDINGDGRLDIITANYSSNTASVLLGNGNGTFAAEVAFAAGDGPLSVALGDLNGDGRLDITTANFNSGDASVLLNSLAYTGQTATVDAPPSIIALTSTNSGGTYTIGDTITVKAQFSEALNITGNPRLQLETGTTNQYAIYTSLSTTAISNDTITFTYTVQAGDSSIDLDQLSTTALELNGGTITDAIGNNANLALAAPGEPGSLGANAALVIDSSATRPVVPGNDGSNATYESSQGDFNGDGINDDTQANVATFLTSDGPTSLAIKDPAVNQVVDQGGSVTTSTQLHFDAAVTDSNAANGLLGQIVSSDPTAQVSAVSDLLSFTVTPTVTTAGNVSGLDVSGITTSAKDAFEASIQEVDIYFQESTINNGWNGLYKKKANGDYYLFNYDPLTGLGAMLLDRDGNGSVDGAKLYLKDGALGDFDESVNGQIVDPIGFTSLSVDPTLRVTNGADLTVDGVEGTGLWVSLAVSSFNSPSQSNLEMYNNGQPIGAIGATLGSGPTGSQTIYLAAGSTLSFRSNNGAGQINTNPALSINPTANGFTLGLDVDLNGIYTDMMLDIRSAIAASSPASLAIARKQLSSSDTILDLTSIAATGITLTLDISTDCGLRNQFGFVRLELDPLTGTTYQVNGFSQNDGAAFRSAVLSQFTNPYQGTGTSHRSGQSRQSISWALDSSAAGYYAPVMITQGGEVLTFGASTASDGRQHVKFLGTNTFGFEDLLASQGSDWDFNDTKIRVSVA